MIWFSGSLRRAPISPRAICTCRKSHPLSLKVFYLLEKRLLFGKLPGGLFGKQECSVNRHFKDSPRGSDQFGFHAESLLESRRQTGGRRLVVSNSAVFDCYSHAVLSFQSNASAGLISTGASPWPRVRGHPGSRDVRSISGPWPVPAGFYPIAARPRIPSRRSVRRHGT